MSNRDKKEADCTKENTGEQCDLGRLGECLVQPASIRYERDTKKSGADDGQESSFI